MRTVLLASLRTHTRRYVAAALAVTVGVAFVVITAGLSAAARDGLTAGVAAPVENATVVARGVDGVEAGELLAAAEASGVEASVLGSAYETVRHDGRLLEERSEVAALPTTSGLRWPTLVEGAFPAGAGEAAVAVDDAERSGVAVGDRLEIGTGDDATTVTVVGLVESPSTLLQPGVYTTWADLAPLADSLYVESVAWLDSDASVEEQTAAILDVAPDAEVLTRDEYVDQRQAEVNNGVDVLATVLLLFASIALFVSVLVIANTFSILFAQRQRDLALLRCVGATRRQVLRSVRLEALVLGLASSALGLVLGTGSAVGIVAFVDARFPSADLGAASVSPGWYAGALVVGLLVTLVASWLPTRRVTRVSPLAALRPDTATDPRTAAGRLRVVIGAVVVVAGVGLLGAAVVSHQPLAMVGGGVATFTGVLLLGPLLVPALIRVVGTLVGRLVGTPGRLATGNAVRNPRRTAATAGSLLVGVTLTTAVLTGMASARSAVDGEMERQHPLDASITVAQGVPDELLDAVRATDGVVDALAVDGLDVEVEGLGETVVLGAPERADVVRGDGATLRPGPHQVLLPYAMAGDLREGDTVAVTVGGASERLRVVVGEGWGDAALVAPATLSRLGDATHHALWLRVDDGADADGLQGDLDALATTYDATAAAGFTQRAYVDLQLDVVTGAVVGLLGVAIVIALVGIGNTLGLSVLERAREHALLRALGLTRRQLRATLALEAVLLSVVATLLGTALGVAFAWVGVETLVRDVVATAPLLVPLGQLGLVVLVAGAAGLASCVLPSRRAARTSPAAGLAAE